MKDYCTYILQDPRKPGFYNYGKYNFCFEPYYVGQGKYPDRVNTHIKGVYGPDKSHHEFVKIYKSLKDNALKPVVTVIEPLSREGSLELENQLITIIGLKSTNSGPLTNSNYGGTGAIGNKNFFYGGNFIPTRAVAYIVVKPDDSLEFIPFGRTTDWCNERGIYLHTPHRNSNSFKKFGLDGGRLTNKSNFQGWCFIRVTQEDLNFKFGDKIEDITMDNQRLNSLFQRMIEKNTLERLSDSDTCSTAIERQHRDDTAESSRVG